jgi:hypothetical protein
MAGAPGFSAARPALCEPCPPITTQFRPLDWHVEPRCNGERCCRYWRMATLSRPIGRVQCTSELGPMEHMTSATIQRCFPRGAAKSLQHAGISNWTGKAVAAPRTELHELVAREEHDKAGVSALAGGNPLTSFVRSSMRLGGSGLRQRPFNLKAAVERSRPRPDAR